MHHRQSLEERLPFQKELLHNSSNMNPRDEWIQCLARTVDPVLSNMAKGTLQQNMPVTPMVDGRDRSEFRCLEALGRLFAGIAPWLAQDDGDDQERALREEITVKFLTSVENGVDNASPDRIHSLSGRQILVDSAFLCQGFLRSWDATWERLDDGVQQRVIENLISTREFENPDKNNWMLFTAMREAFLIKAGAEGDPSIIRAAFEKHLEWYKGDGVYGDGREFHWDYYNSFVIQPMMLDLLPYTASFAEELRLSEKDILDRARRYADIQERLIAPDGTYPATGRSLTYRFGAFQLLGQMALRHDLPEGTSPAQVRCAMTGALRATMYAEHTYDENGWLNIGLAGHQPDLGESYICCGSLYLTLCGFLPLGLPASDPFWSDPDESWSAQKIWSGEPVKGDRKLLGLTHYPGDH